MSYSKHDVASMIDHTLLRADASSSQVEQLCKEAAAHHFASVCVNPSYVPLCAEMLADSDVAVCTVIGFPLGATTSASKAFEAAEAVRNGATEVDMVVNVGRIKSGDWEYVETDIRAVVDAAGNAASDLQKSALVKVIIETCLLTEEEKIRACEAAKNAGADFVKTSTGFSTGGATVPDIALMRKTVGDSMGVKASGGIRTTRDALAMIDAGANRIGASAGIAILEGME